MQYSNEVKKYVYNDYVKHMKIYFTTWWTFEEFIENHYFEDDFKDAVITLRKQKLKKLKIFSSA